MVRIGVHLDLVFASVRVWSLCAFSVLICSVKRFSFHVDVIFLFLASCYFCEIRFPVTEEGLWIGAKIFWLIKEFHSFSQLP